MKGKSHEFVTKIQENKKVWVENFLENKISSIFGALYNPPIPYIMTIETNNVNNTFYIQTKS